MAEYMKKSASDRIRKIIGCIMLVLFLPVLFCVMFIGNGMDYWEDVKADILVPNALLTLIAFALIVICVRLIRQGKKYEFTKRVSRYTDLILAVLFTFFYFFCIWLSNETVFDMSVDQGIVREAAKDVAHRIPFGYQFVFSMNYNNLPITYVLGRLYGLAEGWTWFPHDPEYLWVMTGCLSVTLAGFCCCEIVKRLTKNVAAVLIAFVLWAATAGLSPWKAMPYTDSYGILFPVLCVLLYFRSRDCRHTAGRILLLFLSLASGMAGGFMKPSAYIAVLAVLGAEGVDFLEALFGVRRAKGAGGEISAPETERSGIADTAPVEEDKPRNSLRSSALSLLLSLFFVVALYKGNNFAMDYIVKDIGLDYNEEIEATAQYFFFMGTKELTTGGFSTEDYGIFGEFQFSKADRNAACMERAWERIRERGFFGTVYFCLRKLVKSFNDGTFAWTYVLYYEPFPENLTHDNIIAGYMRLLFVPGLPYQAYYDTFAELIWILILMGIPGALLIRKRKDYRIIFPIMVTGILTYLMLFESGARYVYVFLPVFVVMSVCGMCGMEAVGLKVPKLRKRKGKTEDAPGNERE